MIANPELSAVVVGDGDYETIKPLIQSLALQREASRIEVVAVVAGSGVRLQAGPEAEPLGAIRFVEITDTTGLREARRIGFDAATAPIILLAETHCFPGSGWLDAVLAAHAEGWAIVGPRMGNANPGTATSWAAFLEGYGIYHLELERRPVSIAAGHNSTFSRADLVSFGDDLPSLLRDFLGLYQALAARGSQPLLEPAALMMHTNLSTVREWLPECWAAGRTGAALRSRRWSIPKRTSYALAWPLIAAVEIFRRVPTVRTAFGRIEVPKVALPLLVAGIALRCLGEAAGFLLGRSSRAELRLDETEIHRLRIVRACDRESVLAALDSGQVPGVAGSEVSKEAIASAAGAKS